MLLESSIIYLETFILQTSLMTIVIYDHHIFIAHVVAQDNNYVKLT
jgi:hypothetical protein